VNHDLEKHRAANRRPPDLSEAVRYLFALQVASPTSQASYRVEAAIRSVSGSEPAGAEMFWWFAVNLLPLAPIGPLDTSQLCSASLGGRCISLCAFLIGGCLIIGPGSLNFRASPTKF